MTFFSVQLPGSTVVWTATLTPKTAVFFAVVSNPQMSSSP